MRAYSYTCGVIIGGAPVGEPAFVEHVLGELEVEIVSYIQTTVHQLRSSRHSAWACLYHSAQHRFDHMLRVLPPDAALPS